VCDVTTLFADMTSPSTVESRRVDSVDLLRGLVMILMALDHTRDFIGNVAANSDESCGNDRRAVHDALDHAFLRADLLAAHWRRSLPHAPPPNDSVSSRGFC
jgi:uncharacterized membrane protein